MMFLSALALATAVFSTVATATDPNKWPPVPTWLPEHGTSVGLLPFNILAPNLLYFAFNQD